MTTPSIPPRPSRSLHPTAAASSTADTPKIPPRPTSRHVDRSVSPSRFAPSPFNELPNSSSTSLARVSSRDLPARPPSVSLPSIGQEGSEYADIDYSSDAAVPETRNIGGDLKLHAPKPSLPKASAKARIQTVTRTDSAAAAAAGIGSLGDESDTTETAGTRSTETPGSGPRSRPSFSRPESSASGRRVSVIEDDHGIPNIGQRVPMNPNAGDIQAPSTPNTATFAGAGSGTNGTHKSGRHHNRTKSGRDLPPGSYGLHGHGMTSQDKFEKAWYDKHPDAAARDEGHYGPGLHAIRAEWALSSDDLNKLVHSSANASAASLNRVVPSIPDEQIGYLASEEYASRLASPAPGHNKRSSVGSMKLDSPLRQSFTAEDKERDAVRSSRRRRSEIAAESEGEDEVIHVDEPSRPTSKIGGGGYDPPTVDLGPEGGNTSERGGWIDERGYDTPILASDEVAKEVGGEYMHPAVSPRRQSFETGHTSRPGSVSGSRPNSMHLPSLSRYVSRDDREDAHTPLEDVEEYEPLFPEDDGDKPISAADRFKQRPDVKRRFPSQDIWEDSPGSAHLSATVETPESPVESGTASPASQFETPESEAARKEEVSESEKQKLIPREERLAKSVFRPELRDDMPTEGGRPNLTQRFPSRDIWEDTPESHQLVTTVGESEPEASSPVEAPAKPSIPPRPIKRTVAEPSPLSQENLSTSPTDTKKAPTLPDRPKPQIPARPAKSTAEPAAESPAAKTKPVVPQRPGGSKIAALKAGFLSDLNKTLQLGPQAPKPKEEEPAEETEKAPLADARKGRARGPQRRKPASSPQPESAAVPAKPAIPTFSFSMAQTVFHNFDSDKVVVPGHSKEEAPSEAKEAVEEQAPVPTKTVAEKAEEEPVSQAPPLAKNTAGEDADPAEAELESTQADSPLSEKASAPVTSEQRTPITAEAGEAEVADGTAVRDNAV